MSTAEDSGVISSPEKFENVESDVKNGEKETEQDGSLETSTEDSLTEDEPKTLPDKNSGEKVADGSEEDEEEEEEEERKPTLLERPYVLEEGHKREKKKVERLEVSISTTPKDRKVEIEEGTGEKLGEIPRVEFFISKTHYEDLKPLHRLLFGRLGSTIEVKRNLRKFSGFTFGKDSVEYNRKMGVLGKFTMSLLKSVCEVLDVERGGAKDVLMDRLMEFLMSPRSTGKPLPKPKRKRKSTDKGKKRKKVTKSKTKEPKKKRAKKEIAEVSDEESSNEDSGGEDSEEEPPPKKKAPPPKKAVKVTNQKKPAKKAKEGKPVKKVKKSKPVSDRSESSASSSDDEEPLISKTNKAPTDDDIRDTVKRLLDGANLEEVTMKTICKQVYAKYPDFDLTQRKEFIKNTVKQIIR